MSRALLLPALLGCLLAAGCGGRIGHDSQTAGAPTGAAGVILDVRTVPGVGPVLVDNAGLTLYSYAPDQRRAVTCSLSCQGVWPPVTVSSLSEVHLGAGLSRTRLGTDPDDIGGPPVLTYGGWPLYTYLQDAPGRANGQALNINGGLWYAMSPSGQPVTSHR